MSTMQENPTRSKGILPVNEKKSQALPAKYIDYGQDAHAPFLLPLSILTAVLIPFAVSAQDDVQVNVLGKPGAGKFNQANITREENKVIQAVFKRVSVVNAMAPAADGTVLIVGSLAGSSDAPIPAVTPAGPGGTAFVARISSDLRQMQKLLLLPPEFQSARCLDAAPDGTVVVAGEKNGGDLVVARLSPELDKILWTKPVTGDRAVSVSVAPDNTVVVCPAEKPFVSRIAADGSKLIPFGNKETFRTDAGNPDIVKAWWDGCGYAAAGYKGATYHRGGSGGVQALKDGTFVLFTTNFVRLPNGQPDFDPMLLKFDRDGRILWCSNLLDGLPAESDQKNPFLAVDRHTGDLLLAETQHGHFPHNLVSTPGAYLTPDAWFTGDIMIGWIARVDPDTGKPKAATFYFPEMQVPVVAGKRRANSLFPKAPDADADGNIYLTGNTATKLATTLHAFQPESLGGSGFVTVFNKDLSRLIYSSLITSKGFNFTGRSIVATPAGPAVIADFQTAGPGDFVNANADATNYLTPTPASPAGSIMGFYPSAPWKD
jgi:hypothetical protein